ncbi:MAG: FAD-binding oxidoreductase [Deltaproteobacteria bacterium]|nr:FAD-binding oxidoreductase [Deltaproteobacteria bacterium]
MDVVTDPDVLAGYLSDASRIPGRAEALVRPCSALEVAEVVRRCQERGTPLTVSAGRTSTVGGPVPDGGWILSTEHLDGVLAVSDERAVAQAGVRLGALQDRVEAQGRLHPPDPTSRDECTLGATLACNASGPRTYRFGPSRDWVESVEAVLPTGEIVEADRTTPIPAGWEVPRWSVPTTKHAAGYVPTDNLLDLLVGSEGTLGVITRATVRLTTRPSGILGLLVPFPALEPCLAFADAVRGARCPPGVCPWCIEFFDARALDLARVSCPALPRAGAALWFEQPYEGDPPFDPWMAAISGAGLPESDVVVATEEGSLRALHAARHAVPAGVNEEAARNHMPKVALDLAVPAPVFPRMVEAYRAIDLPAVWFGHLGDLHVHVNLLPQSEPALERARTTALALARLAVDLGGSVAGEHGIGRTKRHLLAIQVGAATLAGFRRLKAAADPRWILNRAVLLDPPP